MIKNNFFIYIYIYNFITIFNFNNIKNIFMITIGGEYIFYLFIYSPISSLNRYLIEKKKKRRKKIRDNI